MEQRSKEPFFLPNRLDAELAARTQKQRFTVGGEFNSETADDVKTVENWRAYGMYDYFINPKWGYVSLEDANKWLITTRQGLRFPLIKGLATTLQYNYDTKTIHRPMRCRNGTPNS